MVPSDYRLDNVTARLIERLEGARPTHALDAEKALATFREIADKHVEAAIAEYRENAVDEDPEPHAEFLRREVLGTALPRYHRLAVEMTRSERGGFGFGVLAEPIGRLGLVLVSVLVLWFGLLRFAGIWEVWPLIALDLTLPLWPSLASWLYQRRYRQQLEAIVADMVRIQDSERSFMSRSELNAAKQATAPPNRPRDREVQ